MTVTASLLLVLTIVNAAFVLVYLKNAVPVGALAAITAVSGAILFVVGPSDDVALTVIGCTLLCAATLLNMNDLRASVSATPGTAIARGDR